MKQLTTIGKEEEEAALRVIRSGRLSGYLAGSSVTGAEVYKLQGDWADFFEVNYAVACNSATSGLLAACMALEIGYGDEVIVPFLTMSATACAPNVLGAQIVVANVDEHLCIDVNHVSKLINPNTKAVIATNLFGQPAKLALLRSVCDAAGIHLIEDNAQAIGAKEDGIYTGTIGHVGVFSLNYHKQIQAGEGGMIVTNDYMLSKRLQGAVNHGETYGQKLPGLNLRMPELTAAIAVEQLKKLPDILEKRTETAQVIRDCVRGFTELVPIRNGCISTHYAVPFFLGPGNNTMLFRDGVQNASGIPFSEGYHGDLFRLNLGEKWIFETPKPEGWRSTEGLILFETCAHDVRQEHLDRLKSYCGVTVT